MDVFPCPRKRDMHAVEGCSCSDIRPPLSPRPGSVALRGGAGSAGPQKRLAMDKEQQSQDSLATVAVKEYAPSESAFSCEPPPVRLNLSNLLCRLYNWKHRLPATYPLLIYNYRDDTQRNNIIHVQIYFLFLATYCYHILRSQSAFLELTFCCHGRLLASGFSGL